MYIPIIHLLLRPSHTFNFFLFLNLVLIFISYTCTSKSQIVALELFPPPTAPQTPLGCHTNSQSLPTTFNFLLSILLSKSAPLNSVLRQTLLDLFSFSFCLVTSLFGKLGSLLFLFPIVIIPLHTSFHHFYVIALIRSTYCITSLELYKAVLN